jgi:SAM-dependent methyltransferase
LAPINPAPPVTKIFLRDKMLFMVDIICALCGQKQQVRTLFEATFKEKDLTDKTYSARRMPDRIHYRILKCDRCSLIFSSPVFTQDKLVSFYRNSRCSYKDQVPYLIKAYYNLISEIKDNLPENPKVLEVGCGNGFFLKALIDLKFTKNVFGVEPSSKMVQEADPILKNKIKVDIFKSGLFSENSFDLILCFHTLDHMFDPKKFVLDARTMLKKNGYVIVVVHDSEGLSVKLFGEKSAIFDVEHIYLFNKKTLTKIFGDNGFKIIKISDLVNTYPLAYWMKMSGFPNALKKIAKFILNFLRIDGKEISISAGNIALIAKKNI